ncbi:hypothetical protein [Pseudomonas sp. PA1(2017)]|nr:hypothetical protein [Pseudomonas sp. PA1(2017)]
MPVVIERPGRCRIRYQNADLLVDREALARASIRGDQRFARSRIELYW